MFVLTVQYLQGNNFFPLSGHALVLSSAFPSKSGELTPSTGMNSALSMRAVYVADT